MKGRLRGSLALLLSGFLASSCTSIQPRTVYSPEGAVREVDWTQAKWHEGVAVKTLSQRTGSSTHLVRIEDREKPHVHDAHDLVAVVLEGKVLVHLGGREILAKPGDVIEVPRGTIHWAENRARGRSKAYAVFSPPFDGKDHRLVAREGGKV